MGGVASIQDTKKRIQRNSPGAHQAQGESGTALILALTFLLILTFLGLASLHRTTVDLRSTAAFRQESQVFYAVEGALEAVLGDGFYAQVEDVAPIPLPGRPSLDTEGVQIQGTLEFIGQGLPPKGSGFSAKRCHSRHMKMSLTGTRGDQSHAQEALVARVICGG